MRLVDADMLIKTIPTEEINARMAIATAPTIEAEPKHGRWIKVDKHTVKCSECGNYLDMRGVNAGRGDANFCPNCGARMDEPEAEP